MPNKQEWNKKDMVEEGMVNSKLSLKELLNKAEENEMTLLGVEYEKEADSDEVSEEEVPYRVDDIRIDQKMISLFQMCRWIDMGTLNLRPEYQRNLVWNLQKKSLLIESLMLRIPIPAFYLDEDSDGNKTVIDGLQRLSTIHDFINGGFSLKGLQYLKECNKKTYMELDKKYTNRIDDTQFAVNILDVRCPDMVKFDVFRRINTGGVALNSQEVRNIMANTEARNLLGAMSASQEFLSATRHRVNDVRMGAQELCLRFIAYYRIYDKKKGFTSFPEMTKLLDQTMLDVNEMSARQKAMYLELFKKSMRKCEALFGEKTFSKPQSPYLINRALFTSLSIFMDDVVQEDDQLRKKRRQAERVMERYMKVSEYYNAITSSTGSRNNMEIQFDMAKKLLEELDVL